MNLPDNLDINELVLKSPRIKEALAVLYSEIGKITQEKAAQERLLKALINISPDRPKGWSMRSNACYYKEKFGKILAGILVEFVKGHPKNIFVASKSVRVSSTSMKFFLNQAWLWLIEHDEEKGPFYKILRTNTMIIHAVGGAKLVWNEELSPAMIELIQIEDHGVKWKNDILDFVEHSEDGSKLELKGLNLSVSQMEWIKKLCSQISDVFILAISTGEVIIMRNKDMAKYSDAI